MPDEYYEPDFGMEGGRGCLFGIEVSGRGEEDIYYFFFNRNVSNVSSFFSVGLPDEYYEPDFEIEISGRGKRVFIIFF